MGMNIDGGSDVTVGVEEDTVPSNGIPLPCRVGLGSGDGSLFSVFPLSVFLLSVDDVSSVELTSEDFNGALVGFLSSIGFSSSKSRSKTSSGSYGLSSSSLPSFLVSFGSVWSLALRAVEIMRC